jgi:hypothetical protein
MPDFDSAAALSRSGPESLSALLATGTPPAGLWRPDEMAAIFSHQMAAPLLVDLGNYLPPSARQLEPLTTPQGAPLLSFADLIHHPNPPIELLALIKDFSKTNASHPENGLPKEIAAVLYYAAIGSALLRLKARISRLSDAELRRGLCWAGEQPWLDPQTRLLMAQALTALGAAQAPDAPAL